MSSPVAYTFEPGTTVYVLIPNACPSTYFVKLATVSRVEIKVSQALPADIVSISYVVIVSDDNQVKTLNESDVFATEPAAVTEALARYSATF